MMKYLRAVTIEEKRFIIAHGVRGFSLWSLGPIISRPVMRQSMMAESLWWGKVAHWLGRRDVRDEISP